MSQTAQKSNEMMIISTMESLVPQDHLVRKLDTYIDWSFIYDITRPLYSDRGRNWTDPVLLFKMIFINKLFGINSMRKTCEEVKVNIAYRWFLNLSFEDKVPDHSTYSQNYRRKFKESNVAEQIFLHILSQLYEKKLIDVKEVFFDGTHIKANANKNKFTKEELKTAVRHYQKELDEDIAIDRTLHGKKQRKEGAPKEQRKHTKVSKNDPESGVFHKGEKERCFAYSANTACDKHGYILGTEVVAGNIHDSQSFYGIYEQMNKLFHHEMKYVVADAGYITPHICKMIFENGQVPILPYKRPMTKDGFYKKNEYVYDEGYDCYLCPNIKVLKYTTTTREGYREYKSNPRDCEKCALRKNCTESKNHQKVVTRHVWENYREEAVDHIRHTNTWKEIYPKRKETIERVFADGKSKHGMGFTRYTGKKRVTDDVLLLFASMNMKKMVNYLDKTGAAPSYIKDLIIQNLNFIGFQLYVSNLF